ncbi:MAG TPA: hypothetical protein O0X70_07720 [Methanocorpusculum sp.]|nr:hypothetical protein [Methanocorpusculum sp.]
MASHPDTEQNDPVTEYIYHPSPSFCPNPDTPGFDADLYMDKLMQRRREILSRGTSLHFLHTLRLCSRLRRKVVSCGKKVYFLKQTAKVSLLKTVETRRLR